MCLSNYAPDLLVPLLMGGLVFWKEIPVSMPASYPQIYSQYLYGAFFSPFSVVLH